MSKTGYLGIPGSYSHTAAKRYFKSGTRELVGLQTFADIFVAIKSKKIDYGVIPIENTLAGSIYENYDLLESSDIPIVGEHYVKVSHNLLAKPESKIGLGSAKNPMEVYSHPKALEQCSDFLRARPWMKLHSYGDTATAAQFASTDKSEQVLAIGSKEAAKLYNLEILQKNIENNPQNYTRFLVIGSKPNNIKNGNKCSMIMYLPHHRGSLYNALATLFNSGCSITKIESRPLVGRPFEYIFYFDFKYDAAKHDILEIIKDLNSKSIDAKLLGSYKLAEL